MPATTSPSAPVQMSPETRRQAVTFVAIGAICTAAYLAIYLLLRTTVAANTANVAAQLITTVASTAANRRFTMKVTDPSTAIKHHAQMVALFLLGLWVNAQALALLAAVLPSAGSLVEIVVLMLSGGLTSLIKIGLMRTWTHSPDNGHTAGVERAEIPVLQSGPPAKTPDRPLVIRTARVLQPAMAPLGRRSTPAAGRPDRCAGSARRPRAAGPGGALRRPSRPGRGHVCGRPSHTGGDERGRCYRPMVDAARRPGPVPGGGRGAATTGLAWPPGHRRRCR